MNNDDVADVRARSAAVLHQSLAAWCEAETIEQMQIVVTQAVTLAGMLKDRGVDPRLVVGDVTGSVATHLARWLDAQE